MNYPHDFHHVSPCFPMVPTMVNGRRSPRLPFATSQGMLFCNDNTTLHAFFFSMMQKIAHNSEVLRTMSMFFTCFVRVPHEET